MSASTVDPVETREPLAGFEFSHATRRVIYGAGTFSQVAEIVRAHGASRVFAVLDPYFATHPLRARIEADLPNLTCHPIPEGEPCEASVTDATSALTATRPDVVIAIGGGSAIDTAKASLMFAANPGRLGALFWPEAQISRGYPALFIAVATTAGAGSEVSETAIVDMPGTVYKSHMRSPFLAPDVAILDPELGVSAPRSATLTSGFDALTHALEAYVSRAANPMTDPLALSGAALLIGNLKQAANVPDDVAARGACLLGSAQAGIAFNSAHLGISHAIAGALGALCHVPHGLANALALPWVMEFNRPAMVDKDRIIARLFAASTIAEGVARMRHDLGLDHALDRYLPDEADLDAVAAAAMTSGQIKMNPRDTTQGDIRAIIEAMRSPTGDRAPVLNL